jgi:hypothetical protein
MSGLESRLQGSGDPHTEHSGIYLPGAIFRWHLSVGALWFDSGVDHPGPSQRLLNPKEQCVDTALILAVIMVGLFAAYNLFHYMLFFVVTHPRDAGDIGHALNEFERRQLVEWTPKAEDFSNTTTRIARTTTCLVGIAERMTITARAFSVERRHWRAPANRRISPRCST